uniref:Uncharacterized protein n=1 Tax=Rhizophora mucronata TaxID=61149 RepID=A0A2P2P3E4_RHIMU
MHFLNKDISQKSVSASCGFGSMCGSTPVHSMQTIFFGTPEPRMSPLHFGGLDNSKNHKIQAPSTSGTVKPRKTRPESQICSLNRNPADFSIPDDKNEYMIKGEDLKIREGILAANGSRLVCLDVHKRQRKHSTAKEGCI